MTAQTAGTFNVTGYVYSNDINMKPRFINNITVLLDREDANGIATNFGSLTTNLNNTYNLYNVGFNGVFFKQNIPKITTAPAITFVRAYPSLIAPMGDGVSTADAVAVRKHEVGTLLLTNYHQKIAGDVMHEDIINGGVLGIRTNLLPDISTHKYDAWQIGQIVLGNFTPSNSKFASWRFFFDQAVIINPDIYTDPFGILGGGPSSSLSYPNYLWPNPIHPVTNPVATKPLKIPVPSNNLAHDYDFYAIKTGDVNKSIYNSFPLKVIDKKFDIQFNTTSLSHHKKDEIVELSIGINTDVFVSGTQFALKYDANSIELSDGSDINLMHTTHVLENGTIKFAWISPSGKAIDISGEKTLRFKCKILKDLTTFEDIVSVERSILPIEVLDDDINQIENFQFVVNVNKLESNTMDIFPNPCSNYCNVSLNLIKADTYNFSIFNAEGKIIANFDRFLEFGQNTLELSKELERQNGLFILKVSNKSKAFTHSKTFIKN